MRVLVWGWPLDGAADREQKPLHTIAAHEAFVNVVCCSQAGA